MTIGCRFGSPSGTGTLRDGSGTSLSAGALHVRDASVLPFAWGLTGTTRRAALDDEDCMSDQPSTARPRIRRDTTNGMVGGVAAGLARHLDVDVVWIRLAFVLLTVFGGGFGLVAYLASWLIIPDDDGSAVPLPSTAQSGREGRGARFWTGVVLVAVGGLILLDNLLSPLSIRFGWVSTSQIILPLVLIGIGTLIYRSSTADPTVVARMEQQAEALGERVEQSAESIGARIEQHVERWGEEVERVAEDVEERIERRAEVVRELRSRSRVAPVTFGSAFVTLGGMWLARSLGVPGITVTHALAATLLVIGVGLVAGAFFGRGRGLLATGILLAPVVAFATLIPQFPAGLDGVRISDDGIMFVEPGEQRVESPASLAALPTDATYEFGVGSFVVDLRALGDEVAAAGAATIRVDMGVGSLQVRVPDGVSVTADVELGIGRIRLLDGSSSGGIGVSDRQQITVGDGTGGLLILEIRQGIGDVTVTR